ncbi:hypothetical protein AB0C57_32485, partial [Streptomyces abikoensis]
SQARFPKLSASLEQGRPHSLGERTYTCTTCGAASPRDKNSARVMLVRAGLTPAGADGASPPGALLQEAA